MRPDCCETCRWWDREGTRHVPIRRGVFRTYTGESFWMPVCRKTPMLPNRAGNDWCGEWAAREHDDDG